MKIPAMKTPTILSVLLVSLLCTGTISAQLQQTMALRNGVNDNYYNTNSLRSHLKNQGHEYVEYHPVNYVNQEQFYLLLGHITAQSFDSNRLQIARQIASAYPLTSSQIAIIMQHLNFESSRVDFAKYAWHYVMDPQNYFMINQAFVFSSSVNELYRYTTGS